MQLMQTGACTKQNRRGANHTLNSIVFVIPGGEPRAQHVAKATLDFELIQQDLSFPCLHLLCDHLDQPFESLVFNNQSTDNQTQTGSGACTNT